MPVLVGRRPPELVGRTRLGRPVRHLDARLAFQDNDPFGPEEVREKLREQRIQTMVGQLTHPEGNNGVPRGDGFGALPAQWWQDDQFGVG